MPTRAQRIEGGLVGQLVGDALGVPYEFENPLPPDQIDFFIIKPEYMTFAQMSVSIDYFCHIKSCRLLRYDRLFPALDHFQQPLYRSLLKF